MYLSITYITNCSSSILHLFHYHLKCKVCGKIIDLYDDSNKFKKYVEDKYDVLFDDATVVIEGKCEKCNGR